MNHSCAIWPDRHPMTPCRDCCVSFFSLPFNCRLSLYSRWHSILYRLLQPIASSVSFQMPISTFDSPLPHTPNAIRAATLQLSKMSFSTSLPPSGNVRISPLSFRTYGVCPVSGSETPSPRPPQKDTSELNNQNDEDGGFIFPRAAHAEHESAIADSTSFMSSQSLNSSFLHEIPGSSTESDGGSELESSIETLPPIQKLSGLSLLRPGSSSTSSFNPSSTAPPSSSSSGSSSVSLVAPLGPKLPLPLPILVTNDMADATPTVTPMDTPRPSNSPLPSLLQPQINSNQSHVHWRSPRSIIHLTPPTSPSFPIVDEQTPLLGVECQNHDDCLHSPSNSTADDQDPEIGWSVCKTKSRPLTSIFSLASFHSGPFRLDINQMKHTAVVSVPHYLMQAVNAVPAVLLGTLLNILDGVSCELFLSLLICFQ